MFKKKIAVLSFDGNLLQMLLVPWSTFFHALESKLHTSLDKDEAAFKVHLGTVSSLFKYST